MPPERVDAILDALRAASMTHPAYLGGPATPTQQLRASTPPQGLGAEASQAVRRAAVKAFQVRPASSRGWLCNQLWPARFALN